MQIDFLNIWLPPINLYSAPHILKIARITESDMLDEVHDKHKILYEEWVLRGKPQLDWKMRHESESEYRPVDDAAAIGPIWSSVFDFRFAERRTNTASAGPETELQKYWFKKGYNAALIDVKDKVETLAAKRSQGI